VEAAVARDCCDASARQVRIAQIQDAVQADVSLSPENRILAGDMLRHCTDYATTNCANCVLCLGIFFLGNSVIQFGVRGHLFVAVIMLLAAAALLGVWAVRHRRERKARAALVTRETAAFERAALLQQRIMPMQHLGGIQTV
jgi:hypothetical protein